MRKLIQRFSNQPKQLLAVDAVGALVSAFLLGVVLVWLEPLFGIPSEVLYVLALLPCGFVVYDAIGWFVVRKNVGHWLRGIAVMNVLYCVVSLGLAGLHWERLTGLGWLYLVGEVGIILMLVRLEWAVSGTTS